MMPDSHLGLIVAVVAVIVLGLIFPVMWRFIGASESQRRLDRVLDELDDHLDAGHVTKSEYEQCRNVIERDALSP